MSEQKVEKEKKKAQKIQYKKQKEEKKALFKRKKQELIKLKKNKTISKEEYINRLEKLKHKPYRNSQSEIEQTPKFVLLLWATKLKIGFLRWIKEIKRVRWPSSKKNWKSFITVAIFSIIFVLIIIGLATVFSLIWRSTGLNK